MSIFKFFVSIFIISISLTGCFENLETRGGIQGKLILDKQNELEISLEGIKVVVKGTNTSVSTDLNGYFLIKNLPSKKYTLIISRDDFDTKEIDIDVEKGKMVNVYETLGYKYGIVVGNIKYTIPKFNKSKVEILYNTGVNEYEEVNDSGVFIFKKVIPGSVDISIKSDGYTSFSGSYKIEKGKIVDLNRIFLESNLGEISGRITLEYSDVLGAEMEDTLIQLDNNSAINSNKKGEFNFSEIVSGNHLLKISKAGYISTTTSINVVAGKTLDVEIFLKMEQKEQSYNLTPIKEYQMKYNFFHSLQLNEYEQLMGVKGDRISYLLPDIDGNILFYLGKSTILDFYQYKGKSIIIRAVNTKFIVEVIDYNSNRSSIVELEDVYSSIESFAVNQEHIYLVCTPKDANDLSKDFIVIDISEIVIKSKTKIKDNFFENSLGDLRNKGIAIEGTLAYLSLGKNEEKKNGGIVVLDISNPEQPLEVKRIEKEIEIIDFKYKDKYLYSISRDSNNENKYFFDIISTSNMLNEISNSLNLNNMNLYPYNGKFESGMYLYGDILYLFYKNRVFVYRIINEQKVEGLKMIELQGDLSIVNSITANENLAYIACGSTIRLLDVTFKNDIKLYPDKQVTSETYKRKLYKEGENLYYLDDIEGIKVFNVKNVNEPFENIGLEKKINSIVELENNNKICAMKIYKGQIYLKTLDKLFILNIAKNGDIAFNNSIDFSGDIFGLSAKLEIFGDSIIVYSKLFSKIWINKLNTMERHEIEKNLYEFELYSLDNNIYFYNGFEFASFDFSDEKIFSILNSDTDFDRIGKGIKFYDYIGNINNYLNAEVYIERDGNFIYLANNYSDTIKVIDIRERNNPKLIKEIETGVKKISSISINGKALFVTDENNNDTKSVTVVDVRNPYTAKVIKRSTVQGMAMAVVADEKYVYTLIRNYGLVILNR